MPLLLEVPHGANHLAPAQDPADPPADGQAMQLCRCYRYSSLSFLCCNSTTFCSADTWIHDQVDVCHPGGQQCTDAIRNAEKLLLLLQSNWNCNRAKHILVINEWQGTSSGVFRSGCSTKPVESLAVFKVLVPRLCHQQSYCQYHASYDCACPVSQRLVGRPKT